MPGLSGFAVAKVQCESLFAVTSSCRACGAITLEDFHGPTGAWTNARCLSFPRSTPFDCNPEHPADTDFIVEALESPIWFGTYKMTFEFRCATSEGCDDLKKYTVAWIATGP